MDYDHFYIEERIREARRLRAEAAGEIFSAAWAYLRRTTAHLGHALAVQLRSHHLLPH